MFVHFFPNEIIPILYLRNVIESSFAAQRRKFSLPNCSPIFKRKLASVIDICPRVACKVF